VVEWELLTFKNKLQNFITFKTKKKERKKERIGD
jgi:hypothetical protein